MEFKKGDAVFLYKRGKIGWEARDWTLISDDRSPILQKNIKYVVESVIYNSQTEQIKLVGDYFSYHPDHFKKYEDGI